LAVHSSSPLPGLLELPPGDPDITVEYCSEGAGDEQGFNWIHEWKTPSGQVTIAGAKRGDSYLLRFPGLADYYLNTANAVIRAFPQDGVAAITLSHLLVDQVIPRLICHGGRMVMHASAVELNPDCMVAFLGDTGRGKSTLASSYVQSGARLLTDDCLLVEKHGSGLLGIPAYPSLRLWPDSLEEIFPDAENFAAMAHYTNKRQLQGLEAEQASSWPAPVSMLFILGDADKAPQDNSILLDPVSGTTAMMAMIESAFALDVVSEEAVRRNFQLVAEVAQSGVPVFALNYARRYELLPKVRAAVEKVVHS
jgi:hypothetical protein